jgi:hypothetical protein
MPWNTPVVARLLSAVMLASVVGGLSLSNQWDFGTGRLQLGASRPTAASPEMMRVLRDEHGLVAEMAKAQMAKPQLAASPIAATGRR